MMKIKPHMIAFTLISAFTLYSGVHAKGGNSSTQTDQALDYNEATHLSLPL